MDANLVKVDASVLCNLLKQNKEKLGVLEDTLTEILAVERTQLDIIQDDREIVYITFPKEGGTYPFPAKTTIIDLWTGVVTFPDGSTANTSTSLSDKGKEYARSIFIDTDQEIIISLDEGGKHTISANDYFLATFMQFQRVYIVATKTTNITCLFCTNPEAVIKKLKTIFLGSTPATATFTAGNPYVETVTCTLANTDYSVDLNAQLGRNAHHGYLKADLNNTGVMKFKFSSDGTTFHDNYITDFQNGDAYDLEGMDIDTLKGQSTSGGDIYVLVAW
ncbi:hypothetical protein LCGC14_2741330 [marine sediment metagenome]|uniref:Uncharacterized protein n=1 Tax=marine sediment metagenome TaxID=412755 RepID=A0A0F8Z4D3_9ZZZZ